MKKKIFYKLQQLNSQSSIDISPKKNDFNKEEYSYSQINNKKFEINNQENNTNNINNITEHKKHYNIPKKGKIGNLDYEIEPRNILLIPENFNINNNNLRICEKELLPKEKNYFISEKNFQLIKDTLNEKEEIIKELNYLLEKMKKQNNNINNKIIYSNKEENKEKITLLEEENKKLEKINNELIFQIGKKNIYFNKIYQLLKFVFRKKDIKTQEINNFIKEQDLEILFDDKLIDNQNNNEENLVDILFKTNKDMILNDLENYKKKYNDIRKQLNYITNMKYNDKINENDSNKIIIDYQKKINELYLSNQNYIKENTYLKLICQNIFLQKKINNLNNNDKYNLKEKNDDELQNRIKYIKKLENLNTNLEKERDILINKEESLLKTINQLKTEIKKIREENEKKLKELSINFDLIKSEKEKLEKIINENKIKESEQNQKEILLNEEIKEIKNKNILLVNELKLEKNKSKELRCCFRNLIIENSDNIFYPGKINLIRNKLDIDNNNDFIRPNSNNFENNQKNNIESQVFKEQISNLDLLMLLFNKSKMLEQYMNNNYED